jgi:NifU-like protein involved in Fe-S cluster formation
MPLKYNKTVMKEFTNPKNMGEIKNPSGIGKIGNPTCGDILWVYIKVEKDGKGQEILTDIKFKTFGCLHPKEKISTPEGWKEISGLSKRDLVFNKNYKKVKIKKIYKGNFNGQLYKIIPFVSKFNSILVTPSHPILCVKRKSLGFSRKSSNKCDWLRINESELVSIKPYYIEAELLEEGDYIIFPKSNEIKDSKKFSTDIMRLMGYYLSEGYITANKSVLNFSFHKNEERYIQETKDLIKKVTGKQGNYRIRNNVCEIYVCSRKWCSFFEEHCNKIAKNKKLSQEILILPFKKQWEMIKTYINGDGNIYKRRKKDSYTYRIDTASKELAIQIQNILTRDNIFASLKKFERLKGEIEGRILKPHTLFNVSFKLDKNHKFVKESKNYFLVPIRKIELEEFKGNVYNLEVEGKEHSYLTKGFIVHNCAAAIATSSMITKLAKGKKLSDAEKIKYSDVVESLGGLPNIKIHCSTMASQALNRAIADYKSKNGVLLKKEPTMVEKKNKSGKGNKERNKK